MLQDAGITAKKLKNALEKELTSGSDASLKTWKKIKPVAGKGERRVPELVPAQGGLRKG